MSLFRTHLRLARASIKENRTRSFLTCLGIAIGIASIIMILSLTGSIATLISSEIKEVGSDLIVVRPSTTKDSVTNVIEELVGANSFQKSNLSLDNATAIANLDNVTAVAPIALTSNTITSEDNTITSATVLGTTPDFGNIYPITLRYGGFITEKNKDNAVVIGSNLSLHLFHTQNPVGRTLTLRDRRFIVVGVLEEVNASINLGGIDYDNTIIMDASVLADLVGSLQIQQINVRVAATGALPEVSAAIREALIVVNSGDTNFSVSYGDDISHPASNLLNIVSGILALVAGISLIVGGIGVMNIMLVSVAERTHEIGIRKAVGASSKNILMQFMFESLILSVLGGIMGIIFGYVCAFFVSTVTPFQHYLNLEILAITFFTSVAVGLIFGTYPALKAASKNPIESLKHYR